MIGLQPHAHPPAQAYGVAKGRRHLTFFCDQDEILIAHQLRDRRGHFRRDPARQLVEDVRRGGVGQQPIAEGANGQRGYRRKGGRLMGIDDQAGDLVVFVRNDGLLQELPERNVGQRDPRRNHLRGAVGGDPGQAIARARRRGFGQEIAKIIEHITGGIDGVTIDHGGSGPSTLRCAVPTLRLSVGRLPRSRRVTGTLIPYIPVP